MKFLTSPDIEELQCPLWATPARYQDIASVVNLSIVWLNTSTCCRDTAMVSLSNVGFLTIVFKFWNLFTIGNAVHLIGYWLHEILEIVSPQAT